MTSRAERGPDNLPLALLLMAGALYLYQRQRLTAPAGGITLPPLDIGPLFGPISLEAGAAKSGGAQAKVTTPAPGAPAGSPRGIRNNNPLNIEYSPLNLWQGQQGSDGRFSRFDTAVHGLRAAFKLLRTYHSRYGLDTIKQLAQRWAPAPENNPTAYAATASATAGIGPNEPLNFNAYDTMSRVLRGFIAVEDGPSWTNFYSDSVMRAAWDAAT